MPTARYSRIASVGHGGQVLLTGATRATVGDRLPAGVVVSELGEHTLKDFPRPEPLFQLAIERVGRVAGEIEWWLQDRDDASLHRPGMHALDPSKAQMIALPRVQRTVVFWE